MSCSRKGVFAISRSTACETSRPLYCFTRYGRTDWLGSNEFPESANRQQPTSGKASIPKLQTRPVCVLLAVCRARLNVSTVYNPTAVVGVWISDLLWMLDVGGWRLRHAHDPRLFRS